LTQKVKKKGEETRKAKEREKIDRYQRNWEQEIGIEDDERERNRDRRRKGKNKTRVEREAKKDRERDLEKLKKDL
jgi:hypothetical protein